MKMCGMRWAMLAHVRHRARQQCTALVAALALLVPSSRLTRHAPRAVPARHASTFPSLPPAFSRPSAPAAGDTARPRFRLGATPAGRPASGSVEIVPAPSPFGVAATSDGRLVFDLTITVRDLPPASSFGPYTHYEAWLTTPKLDIVKDLGSISNDGTLHAQADWNKFTIIVSAEATPVPRKWGPAIVLIGRSQSSLMQSFASHPLFSTPEPD